MTRVSESEFAQMMRSNPELATATTSITVRSEEPPMARAKRIALGIVLTEDDEQREVIAWAAEHEGRYPALALLYHVPNGGARDKATGAMLKAMGVRAGVPDLHLPVARGGHIGLWIEMKRADHSNNPTAHQKVWLDAMRRAGHRVEVCYGADEAIAVLLDYLKGE